MRLRPRSWKHERESFSRQVEGGSLTLYFKGCIVLCNNAHLFERQEERWLETKVFPLGHRKKRLGSTRAKLWDDCHTLQLMLYVTRPKSACFALTWGELSVISPHPLASCQLAKFYSDNLFILSNCLYLSACRCWWELCLPGCLCPYQQDINGQQATWTAW